MIKIVSGAQTGVDRGALDAGLEAGVEVGGWCPEGRKSEDGVIPGSYPVTELPRADYRQRTRQNVVDSDGTAIIYFSFLSGGTRLTLDFCKQFSKPHVLIDGDALEITKAAEIIGTFVSDNKIAILNVAGPRASGEPAAYDYAKNTMLAFLTA